MAKEIIGAYWMIQAKSKEEAIEWARRVRKAADNPAVRAAVDKGRG